ncbi:MAG TPA: hypothetical protein VKE95_09745 [Burkholderiales bacterium]|nr:hypothetical protein [Burkholderiales bacterium]
MFVTSLKWKFDAESIRGTPRTQGVFGLWDEGRIVYIGATARSVYLPDALGELLALKRRGIIQATHFTWEITITPRSWAGELLRLHFNKHGELPPYNQPASALQVAQREANLPANLPLP